MSCLLLGGECMVVQDRREQYHPRLPQHSRFTVLGEMDLFILPCKISQIKFNSPLSLRYYQKWKGGPRPLSEPLEWQSPSCCTKRRGICSVRVTLHLPLPIISREETNFCSKEVTYSSSQCKGHLTKCQAYCTERLQNALIKKNCSEIYFAVTFGWVWGFV